MLDINVELFKKQSAKKKLEIVENLTTEELLMTNVDTVKRILKEVGEKQGKSNNKRIYISREYRAGNDWNSTVDAFNIYKGNVFIEIYLQMDSTDTDICEKYETFIQGDKYQGKHYTMNYRGDEVPHYFTYDKQDKARVIKSILLSYIHAKYTIVK